MTAGKTPLIIEFEERAARAIWDVESGGCSNNCQWGIDRAVCFCQVEALRHAGLALAAVSPVIEARMPKAPLLNLRWAWRRPYFARFRLANAIQLQVWWLTIILRAPHC